MKYQYSFMIICDSSRDNIDKLPICNGYFLKPTHFCTIVHQTTCIKLHSLQKLQNIFKIDMLKLVTHAKQWFCVENFYYKCELLFAIGNLESPPLLLLESISRKILGKVHLVSSQTKDTNKLVCISFIILQYFCLNEKYVTYALRITQNTTEKGAELLPYFTSRAWCFSNKTADFCKNNFSQDDRCFQ